jgi:hypothetical protein
MTTSRIVNKQCNKSSGVFCNLASYNLASISGPTLYIIIQASDVVPSSFFFKSHDTPFVKAGHRAAGAKRLLASEELPGYYQSWNQHGTRVKRIILEAV